MHKFMIPVLMVSILTFTATMAVAQDEPVSIIQKYNDAQAQGDVEAALAFWAEDAIWDGGGLCGRSPCVGKAAIRKRVEAEVNSYVGTNKPIGTYPAGNVVTQRVERRHATTRKAGVERIICWDIWRVKSGKIAYHRHVHERTDPQTARYIAWQISNTLPVSK